MKAELSILTATLCVALILALAGCANVPDDAIRRAIDKRFPKAERQECADIKVTICNGVQT